MKHTDLAQKYSLDANSLSKWLPNSGFKYKTGFLGGHDIEDSQIHAVVTSFKEFFAAEQVEVAREKADAEREQAEQARKDEQKRSEMAAMLITSGFNFDGYTIVKYSGYISGDDAVQIDRGTSGIFSRATDVGASLMTSLSEIRRNAIAELKEAAYALGCNAVIGVDFDYLTLDPQTATSAGGTLYLPYVFGVTANGNAVVIEKKS